MKKIMVLCLVLFSSSANAGSLVTFKDGSAHVWDGYYIKGKEYCTMKSYGEYCVARQDVVSVKEVPPGTAASEYGVSSLGDPNAEQQRDDNVKALDSLNCAQLRVSTSRKAQDTYRDECLSREEQQAWDEEQMRKETKIREAQTEEERARSEEERKKKQKEKIVSTRERRTLPY